MNDRSRTNYSKASYPKELDVPILVLCELPESTDEKLGLRPELRALLRIGVNPEKCDVILLLYREEHYLYRGEPVMRENESISELNEREERWRDRLEKAYGRVELIVASNRNGPTGTVELAFDSQIGKFSSFPNAN